MIQEELKIALEHHRAGRLTEAETIYRSILERDRAHAATLQLLGALLGQTGRPDEAIGLLREAVQIVPNSAKVHSNLANVLRQSGRLEESVLASQRAIELDPNLAAAYGNLGNALLDLKRTTQAIAAYAKRADLDPALDDADMQNALGLVLKKQRRFEEAVQTFRRAVAIQPQQSTFYNNLAASLNELHRFDEAIAASQQAIQLDPHLPEPYFNLANALMDGDRRDDAFEAVNRAISINPNFADAYNCLANLNKDVGQIGPAIDAWRAGARIKPHSKDLHSNRLYSLYFHPDYTSQMILAEHREWAAQWTDPLASAVQPFANDRSTNRRLRIGYVSPDFRAHCQSLFTLPLLSHHDHARFEIFCYSDATPADGITQQLQQRADGWRDTVGQPDFELIEQIRRDQIDILVDLTMHMASGRPGVFACKPAPVQVTWLAYPGTTGIKTIDYRLTDPYLDPPGVTDGDYTEKSIRLPDTFWCYDPLTTESVVNELPALSGGPITFGCLNNFCKVNDGTAALWASVLRAVPDSRLLILSPSGSHRDRLLNQLNADPGRVEFIRPQRRAEYLNLYHRIDLCLDAIPYNGHTTSLDAMWMGVPVVTLVGKTVVGRTGLSQLSNVGLTDLIAYTPAEYVEIIQRLINDLPGLARLRSTLRQRMLNSPLMNAPRFAANVENAYRKMWEKFCFKA